MKWYSCKISVNLQIQTAVHVLSVNLYVLYTYLYRILNWIRQHLFAHLSQRKGQSIMITASPYSLYKNFNVEHIFKHFICYHHETLNTCFLWQGAVGRQGAYFRKLYFLCVPLEPKYLSKQVIDSRFNRHWLHCCILCTVRMNYFS
jgi:hypothetical protein